MKISLGIDTGGTYTDAVLYDFDSHEIIDSAKALTTKDDLSTGIINSISALDQEICTKASIVSMSTTLATNACVENKGSRAKLIFIGVNPDTVRKVGAQYGLPPVEDILFIESKSTFAGEIIQEPDYSVLDDFCQNIDPSINAFAIVEIHGMFTNASREKFAKRLLGTYVDKPIICGHELFSDINCLQRGASALLNAGLIPVINEFIEAVKIALKQKNIEAPMVIVRSDATLMSEVFTCSKPIETLLCGPAASVIGGTYLSEKEDSIIIDMGGTTTDICLVKDNIAKRVSGGINIGNWKTFVKGLYIDTFGLGGDTALVRDDAKLELKSYRILPLSILASSYPYIMDELQQLLDYPNPVSDNHHEFFLRVKDISEDNHYTDEQIIIHNALQDGPLSKVSIAKIVKRDIYSLDTHALEHDGVIIRCGLTPTDIMHIKGDFDKFNTNAAKLVGEYFAMCLSMTVESLCDMVYDLVKKRLYKNIVKILMRDNDSYYVFNDINEDMDLLIEKSYQWAKNPTGNPYFGNAFTTRATLVGLGAPIHVFLPEVAKMLAATSFIPDHANVANALGAVVGEIKAIHTTRIEPDYSVGGIRGFRVYAVDKTFYTKTLEEAQDIALADAEKAARREAKLRGASDDIKVISKISKHVVHAKNGDVDLDNHAIATAVGHIGGAGV